MNSQHRMSKSLDEKLLPENRRIIDPGQYYLERDLVVDDELGILINCSDVLLNLKGHTISHTNGAVPESFGILSSGHHRVTIVNGCIDGFWNGIYLTDTFDSLVSDLAIRNTGYIGIYLSGRESKISDNVLEEPRIDLPRTTDKYVVGIHLEGNDLTVARNALTVNPNLPADNVEYVAILVGAQTTETEIRANAIRSLSYLPKSYGVWIAGECHVVVSKNEISNVQFAVVSDAKDTEVIDNILRSDEVHPDTHGVHIPKNADTSRIAGNTIEGFEWATVLQPNEEPETS